MLVATAGHVDHGKTSLIKHLTGTNTDRLAAEKKRGLTIELGYAFSGNDSDKSIGFIDVPGHQGFINTMISGINGIDLAMLVVAADDGAMPQTLEHLQLLRLLGVERFVGVITKSDLVDPARLDEVNKQVSALIPDSPVCNISNHTGEGLGQLQLILDAQSQHEQQRRRETQFRLYIDRVFIKKGAGVVVTGTCLSGSTKVGDELKLHSSKANQEHAIKVRVREIHSQGKVANSGHAGQRCALNIAGKVSLESVHRGDFLCAHPTAVPSQRLDTRCWTAAESKRAFKHLGRVKLYIGTRRVSARTYFLEREQNSEAGQRIQLILAAGVVAFAGDRFILRDDNESITLGGGIIIDPEAPKRGKSRNDRINLLDALELGSPLAALEQQLFNNGDIVSLNQFKRSWNLSQQEAENCLALPSFKTNSKANSPVRVNDNSDEFILPSALWQSYGDDLEKHLAEWHAARPLEPGIRPEALQLLMNRSIPLRLFKQVLAERISIGKISRKAQLVHATGHRPTISHKVQREWLQLQTHMQARGLQIPLRSELQKDTGFDAEQIEALTRPAIKTGELFEIGEKRLGLPSTLMALANLIKEFTGDSGEITVIEAKQVFGLGRNLTIEILEFFDNIGFTKRSANARLISDSSAAELIINK